MGRRSSGQLWLGEPLSLGKVQKMAWGGRGGEESAVLQTVAQAGLSIQKDVEES